MKVTIKNKKSSQQNNRVPSKITESSEQHNHENRIFRIKANLFRDKNKDTFVCYGSLWKSQNNEGVTNLLVNQNKKIVHIHFQ